MILFWEHLYSIQKRHLWCIRKKIQRRYFSCTAAKIIVIIMTLTYQFLVFIVTWSCLLFLLWGRGRGPGHEDVMLISHPRSLGLTPSTTVSHWNKVPTLWHIRNGQDWTWPAREREIKLDTISTRPWRVRQKSSILREYCLATLMPTCNHDCKCVQCPFLSALTRPSSPLPVDDQSSDKLTVWVWVCHM